MRTVLALVGCLLIVPHGASAQRAGSPGDATVFIRLVGSIHAAPEGNPQESVDVEGVEIGSGSGFVVSPDGYVITNDHVIRNEEVFVTDGLRRFKVALKISRILVCFPPEAVAARLVSSPCAEASVAASDPALDLAVLFISASDLPYVALGDSDAISAGRAVDALGYPFGRQLSLRQLTAVDPVPEVTTTPGAVSALRAGEGGERRFLQVTNNLNPGNSGGPLVDRDGYALGVVRLKLASGAGIGFAIPINQVKDFLESRGLDQLMPGRRLRLGPSQNVEGKGVRIRLPDGLVDASPFRTHVAAAEQTPEGVALRIDRVFSPLSPKQLEQALVGTQTFERVSATASESRFSSRAGGGRLLLGHTMSGSSQEIRMDYAILDLGAEKLVARYIGPTQQMAFNEAALRESLASLEGQNLVAIRADPLDRVEWSTATPSSVPLPIGWVIEPGVPSLCSGLPRASTTVTASPAGDFTVTLRAAVWSGSDFSVDAAASACSSRRSALEGASYVARADSLGTSYSMEGVFIRTGVGHVLQLEVVAPVQRITFAHDLLAAWMKKATEPPSR